MRIAQGTLRLGSPQKEAVSETHAQDFTFDLIAGNLGCADHKSKKSMLMRCDGDHSIYHRTRTVEKLERILDSGFRPRAIGEGGLRGTPAVFFSGLPNAYLYGRIVLATHTGALDRPVYFVNMKGFRRESARSVAMAFDTSIARLCDEEERLQAEAVKGLRALTPEQQEAFMDGAYMSKDARRLKKLDDMSESLSIRIDRQVYRILKRLRLDPCRYAERAEAYLRHGNGLTPPQLESLFQVAQKMGDNLLEHVALGSGKEDDRVTLKEKVGVGLITGKSREGYEIAEEMAKRNIRFTVLSEQALTRDGFMNKPYTHTDFLRN